MQKRSADAEELIRQYKDITDEEKLIHRQYIQMAEAISNYNKAGKLTAVLQQLKTSLHLTTAEIKGQNIHLFSSGNLSDLYDILDAISMR